LTLLSLQGKFKAFVDDPLAEVLDRLNTALEGFGDLGITVTSLLGVQVEGEGLFGVSFMDRLGFDSESDVMSSGG